MPRGRAGAIKNRGEDMNAISDIRTALASLRGIYPMKAIAERAGVSYSWLVEFSRGEVTRRDREGKPFAVKPRIETLHAVAKVLVKVLGTTHPASRTLRAFINAAEAGGMLAEPGPPKDIGHLPKPRKKPAKKAPRSDASAA